MAQQLHPIESATSPSAEPLAASISDMGRNIINEITLLKGRSEYGSRHEFTSRLEEIQRTIQENLEIGGTHNKELFRYVPIATVACFEAFFRSTIKELIDFGKPYSDNVVKFNQAKNVKFDFDIVNAIQTKTVTVGEFISHVLPCNNFDDINHNLSTLAKIDFAADIKQFNKGSEFDPQNISKTFYDNYGQIVQDVKRTFELRHIFCHEFASNFKIDLNEIIRCFENSKIFLTQTNLFIWALLYPDAPETQFEMNEKANKDFEKIDNELKILIKEIISATKKDEFNNTNEPMFLESIEKWKAYRVSM
jgi:hypothetical protein